MEQINATQLNTEQSKAFRLNTKDAKKIIKGLAIACGGAGITYLLAILDYIDVGYLTPLIVAVVSSSLNFLQIWIKGQSN